MMDHNQHKVQLKQIKNNILSSNTKANSNTINIINANKKKTANTPCAIPTTTKPKSVTKQIQKQAIKPSLPTKSKQSSLKQMEMTSAHTNIQSTLSSLNQFTPKDQKLGHIKSTHSNNLIKQRQSTTSSIEKIKNRGDYATIFGLINSEIREITDLFKRTQSVDQQNKKEDLILKKAKGLYNTNNNFNEDIDYVLFEKCLCEEEEEEDEKVLDISNLEESEAKEMNNCDSALFSSYNSELYRNLNKDECWDVIPEPSSMSLSNVVKIAKANVLKNKHSRQKSSSVHAENGSDKTECQYTDVVFNSNGNNNQSSSSSSMLSEKTCDMMKEKEHEVHYVPIQEVMKQIRNYKSQPVCISQNKDEWG